MDEDMWHHPASIHNIKLIEQHGCRVMPVGYGELASGLVGEGRMAEPEEIVGFLEQYFVNSGNLKGKKALVTAGPTYEPIDPVRFIGNHSSGKMGYAIAEELAARGANVILISGPVPFDRPLRGVNLIKVNTAEEMYDSCMIQNDYDIAVMAAAVADYTPVTVSETKIKKTDADLALALKKTKDILKALGQNKKEKQVLVGFALETDNEQENAIKKLKDKNADMLVLNSLNDEGAGFGYDTNKVTFYYKNGDKKALGLKSKKLLAKDIVDALTELL
jgi:phosphopantothenoylcysteine decarboxylase / phosphopantothenate---cysteine ligase